MLVIGLKATPLPSGRCVRMACCLLCACMSDVAHLTCVATAAAPLVCVCDAEDKTAPELTVPDPITKEATGPDGAPVDFAVSAIDVVDGAVTPSCTKPGETEPVAVVSGDVFPLGSTVVTCDAVDKAGNRAASKTFKIIVGKHRHQSASTSPDDMSAASH